MLKPKKLFNFQIFRYVDTFRHAVYIDYKEGSKERDLLKAALKTVIETQYKIPLIVGPEKIMSGDQQLQYMPHNHRQPIAEFYNANARQVKKAVDSVRYIHSMWKNVSHEERAAIWNRAADDIETKSRHILNAANMLSQGKTYKDAEADTCRLINGLRQYAVASVNISKKELKNENPTKVKSTFYLRPIDGFVVAIAPNNMTSISLQLAAIPALMGNCVLWKPSRRNTLSSFIAFQALRHAGLPDGVINFLPMNSQFFYNCCRSYEDLAGINFSGTTHYFLTMWEKALMFVSNRRGMPRVLGEMSSKNFHLIHNSADLKRAAEDTVEAAFTHSGQICSSCSRLYVPKSIWPDFKTYMCLKLSTLKVGDPANFDCFTSAVAGRAVYQYILSYIKSAHNRKTTKVIYDGGYNDTWGYFIEPTIIRCEDPLDPLMQYEINGPVLSVYVFDESDMDKLFVGDSCRPIYVQNTPQASIDKGLYLLSRGPRKRPCFAPI
ncbi:delta-1-pyrroline-5-carboxylate dehydrogenase, mitochondrial-like [Teleopsis dalmanni]|uniref:delta-1-pyrroline-5-carboxylate dehydrogenase, mitochondrial-like n=1 Tax=Teleopsis dalmanni TaxID=139649 RepID=UPI0018CCBE63|nr:delta-1-pyrroline-5-carboxylate dehydrogenase, mitochondrial-like [Teleopsis dalmanni]